MDRTSTDPGMTQQAAFRYVVHPWKKLGLIISVISVMAALALGVGTTLAGYDASSDLDATFSGDGKVTTDFQNHPDEAYALLLQSDGKLVAVGYAYVNGPTSDFALARYNPNGTLDDTFGGDGKVTTPILDELDIANAAALQTNGKIVVGGLANTGLRKGGLPSDFALARYNPNGTLDDTFDGNGILVTVIGDDSAVSGVAIQSDGKIVAAGYSQTGNDTDFALARYNTNGSLDTTFSGDGKVTIGFGSLNDLGRAVLIQSDGKILVAGSSAQQGNYDFAMARLHPNGNLDDTFSGDGKLTTDFGGDGDEIRGIALQANGKIVVAGSTTSASDTDFALARYNQNGTLDDTFNGDGKLTTGFGDLDIARSVAIQFNGKIVAVGGTAGYSFALARYNSNGSLDDTFAGNGKLTTDIGGTAEAVVMQSNGRIVVAGGGGPGGTDVDFGLARYLGDTPPTATVVPTHTPVSTRTPTRTPTPGPPTQTPGGPTATPQATPTSCSIEFADVPPGSTFYSFVRCMACQGIINGYTSGCGTANLCFRPGNNVTRGQLSKIVSNAAGFNEPEGGQQYEDVPMGSTYFTYIWRLSDRGYVSGYPCGGPGEPCMLFNLPYFRPNGNATRGQISKIVSNAAGISDPPGNQRFEDVPPGSTFYDFVQRLSNIGAIGGYACGGARVPAAQRQGGEPCVPPDNRSYFRPNGNATRGQTSKIVANTFFPNCIVPSR